MTPDSREYPVVYFNSDTTGEKDHEEFFVEGESLDRERFASLGVITDTPHRDRAVVEAFIRELEAIFANPAFTKEEVIAAMQRFLPNFCHEEKGKSLDDKM